MTPPLEEPCHCGRPAIVNETLGYSRGMCEDCDAWRCDVWPAGCKYLSPQDLAAIERWRERDRIRLACLRGEPDAIATEGPIL